MKRIVIILAAIDIALLIWAFALEIQAEAAYVNSFNGLCVRDSPGEDGEVLEILSYGDEVSGETEAGWMRLEGREGYVNAEYLQDSDPFDDLEYLGTWKTTAYTHTGCQTASGEWPEQGVCIAHNSLPFGTKVYIRNVGVRVVLDRGPASMGTQWCDLFLDNEVDCIEWGVREKEVYLISE